MDAREKGMEAQMRARQIAAASGLTLAPRAAKWMRQLQEFDKYEGRPTVLEMMIAHDMEQPLPKTCKGSTCVSYGRRIQRTIAILKQVLDEAHRREMI